MVLSPSHAIGSITFRTISSRSFGLKLRAWPSASKIREHLREIEGDYTWARDWVKEAIHHSSSTRDKIWWLTSSGRSPTLLCCTCGSLRQRSSAPCSWTCGRSWRCKLCRDSPREPHPWWAGSPSSAPAPGPEEHTQSCCPRGGGDRLLSLEAGEEKQEGLMYTKLTQLI